MEREVEAEILEPLDLHYSDLTLLLSSTSSCSNEEQERLQSITRTLMETLGPSGPGLLTISGVPKASQLRLTLLPLARKLALLNQDDLRRVLKQHGLGSDVSLKNPDRNVSSFALQLKSVQNPSSDKGGDSSEKQLYDINTDSVHEFIDYEFGNLGNSFKELGLCMMEVGLQLARVCDKVIGGKEIEQSILDSDMAKGRLIHYHSVLDKLLLKEAVKTKGSRKKAGRDGLGRSEITDRVEQPPIGYLNLETHANEHKSCRTSLSNLWQEWHYDYGIFTVLTAPMFISSRHQPTTEAKDGHWKFFEKEYSHPHGHTYLQILEPNKNKILMVRSPPDSFIIQVGESADIISQGKLHSTLHSVSRPVNIKNLSRESFVVFLQPAWNKTLSISQYYKETLILSGQCSNMEMSSSSILCHPEQPPPTVYQKIHKIIPPLSSRLRDGMTFAEFSRETTKQYYSSCGVQSKRENLCHTQR